MSISIKNSQPSIISFVISHEKEKNNQWGKKVSAFYVVSQHSALWENPGSDLHSSDICSR